MACFATVLSPKSFFIAAGLYDESLSIAEDWDLWLRLSYLFPFTSIDTPVYLYRKYPNSLTRMTNLNKALKSQMKVLRKHLTIGDLDNALVHNAMMYKYLEFSNIFKSQKMYRSALNCVFKSFFIYPQNFAQLAIEKLF